MNSITNTVSSFHIDPRPPEQTGNAEQDAAHAVSSNSLLGSERFDMAAMTPDALVFYLSSRIGSVDNQMTDIFNRQKVSEKVRTELRGIQEELSTLSPATDEQEELELTPEVAAAIQTHIENIGRFDRDLAARISAKLSSDGQILGGDAGTFTTFDLNNTKDYLGLVNKDLESGAQMDMIQLQSLMGARQTAIQLSTNLIAALNESQKSVVGNIR